MSLPQALDLAKQYYSANRLAQAGLVCQGILKTYPRQPEALQLLGLIAYLLEKFDQAGELSLKALASKPTLAEAHNVLGRVRCNIGQPQRAIASFRRALACAPDSVISYTNLGTVFRDSGEFAAALTSFRTAIAFRADYARAWDNLVELLEQMNEIEAFRQALAEAERACPGNPNLPLWEAKRLKRDGDFRAARHLLEAADRKPGGKGAVSAMNLVARANLLGDLCDRLGDSDAAFEAFSLANRHQGATAEARRFNGKRFQAHLERLLAQFTPERVADWQPIEPMDDRPDPVFLVGFPRSGTTLLDTILRTHSAITVVEEKPTLDPVVAMLKEKPGGYPGALGRLTGREMTDLRRSYFSARDRFLPAGEGGRLIIDKYPLQSLHVGMLHRIFPKARFLFAERHPCDCVLSCFMQNFKLNDAMVNFLDLEETARFYDLTLSLWHRYRTLLPISAHPVRYEALIESFEATVGAVIAFLDLSWEDALWDYRAAAQLRDKIRTPSYSQVTQPLYRRARGRWHRYRSHMLPVLPILQPWIRKLGYDL